MEPRLFVVITAAAILVMLIAIYAARWGRLVVAAGITAVIVVTTVLAQNVSLATMGWLGHLLFTGSVLVVALISLRFGTSWHIGFRLAMGVASALVATPVAAVVAVLFS